MRALVTGANGDIGLAITQSLLDQGYEVTVLDQAFDKLKKQFKSEIQYIFADLANGKLLEKMLQSWHEPFDVFVYAAGVREIESVLTLPLATWQSILQINISSVFILARWLSSISILNQRPLNIIFISSISGLQGEPHRSAYCASKHGMIGLAKSLAIELAEHHIRVNVIAPGIIETDLTRGYQKSETTMRQLNRNIPLKRWGRPAHIAQTVDYLLSNDYVTGAVFVVDGGWMVGKSL